MLNLDMKLENHQCREKGLEKSAGMAQTFHCYSHPHFLKTAWHSGVFKNSRNFLADALFLWKFVATAAVPR